MTPIEAADEFCKHAKIPDKSCIRQEAVYMIQEEVESLIKVKFNASPEDALRNLISWFDHAEEHQVPIPNDESNLRYLREDIASHGRPYLWATVLSLQLKEEQNS
jgi:hypothetical protein